MSLRELKVWGMETEVIVHRCCKCKIPSILCVVVTFCTGRYEVVLKLESSAPSRGITECGGVTGVLKFTEDDKASEGWKELRDRRVRRRHSSDGSAIPHGVALDDTEHSCSEPFWVCQVKLWRTFQIAQQVFPPPSIDYQNIQWCPCSLKLLWSWDIDSGVVKEPHRLSRPSSPNSDRSVGLPEGWKLDS